MFQIASSHKTPARLFLAMGLMVAATLPALAQGPAENTASADTSSSLEAQTSQAATSTYGPQAQTQGSTQAYPYTIQRTHSYWQTHGFDFAASASGRYQQVVTDQSPSLTNPTEGVGLLVNVREQPVSWFGLELNYSYNHYGERFTSAATGTSIGRIQQDQHEATAGYILHIKAPGIQPFITLGGGGINFRGTKANPQYDNQWRGTYMYEVGFDLASRKHPHFGVRVQEHGLFYKAPDFHVANFRSNGYVHQALPSAGVFFRF